MFRKKKKKKRKEEKKRWILKERSRNRNVREEGERKEREGRIGEALRGNGSQIVSPFAFKAAGLSDSIKWLGPRQQDQICRMMFCGLMDS